MENVNTIYDPSTRRWFFATTTNDITSTQFLNFRVNFLEVGIKKGGYDKEIEETSIFNDETFISSSIYKYKGFLVSDEVKNHKDVEEYFETTNDPVNAVDSTLSDAKYLELDNQLKELRNRIGNQRSSHKRKVEHIGSNGLTLEVLSDISELVGSTIQFLPPVPTNFDEPERINLRSTDKGFVDYIKDNLQTIQNAGQKTIIWSASDIPKGSEVTSANSDVESVILPDLETTIDTSLSELATGLETLLKTFLTEEGAWTIFNIPARSIIRTNVTDTRFIRYDTDFTSVINSFIMKSNGDIDVESTGDININSTGDVNVSASDVTLTTGSLNVV